MRIVHANVLAVPLTLALALSGCDDTTTQQPDGGSNAEDTAVLCNDSKDNDGDGDIDCADATCKDFVHCQQTDAGLDAGGDSAGLDGASGDGGLTLPGCPSGCGPDQVCDNAVCKDVGPAKACGSGDYDPGVTHPVSGAIYVKAGATGDKGTFTAPFATLGKALAAPATGSRTIYVASGSYAEGQALKVTGEVSIICRCAGQVTINDPIQVDTASAKPITVTVDGCRLAPAGVSSTPKAWGSCATPSAGIQVSGTAPVDLLVEDSEIGGWCTGVLFNGASPSSVCVASSRLFANVRGLDVVTTYKKATSPFSQCGALPEGVAVVQSKVDQNRQYGVYTRQGSQGIKLSANLIERSGLVGSTADSKGEGMGVYLGDTTVAEINYNRIRDNNNRGLAMANLTSAGLEISIADNALVKNRGAGITLYNLQATKPVTIKGNLIANTMSVAGASGKDADGIQAALDATTTYDVDITSNNVQGSGRSGINFIGVGGAITSNTITGSGSYGILLQQSSATQSKNTFGSNGAQDVKSVANKLEQIGTLPVPIP